MRPVGRKIRPVAFSVLGAAALLPNSAVSQQWLVGAAGGGISADLVGDDIPDPRWGPRLKFAGGAIVEFWPVAGFGARAEALYQPRGTYFRDEDELFEQRSAYLELPLLAAFGVGVGSGVMFRGFAGPALSFLLRCDIIYGFRRLRTADDPGPAFVEYSQTCDGGPLNYSTRSIDIGFVMGGGTAFSFGGFRLLLEGRLDSGLRTIAPSQYGLDIRNRSYGVTVGLLYRL